MQEVIDTLFDCENDFDVCFDIKSNLTALFALDILRAAVGLDDATPIDRHNPEHVQIFDFTDSWSITAWDALDALRFVVWLEDNVANPDKVRAWGEKWLQLRWIKNRFNFVKQGWDVVNWNYRFWWNIALSDVGDPIWLDNQIERLVIDWDMRTTGNIISSEPTADNHVATKEYVDSTKISHKYHEAFTQAWSPLPNITVSWWMDKWPDFIVCRATSNQLWISSELILRLHWWNAERVTYRDANDRNYRFNPNWSYRERNSINNCGSASNLNIVQICNEGRCSN